MKLLKKIGMVTAGLVGAAYLVSAPFSMYVLHKTQHAVERRFGGVVDVESKPGPHFKDQAYIPIWGSMLTTVERYDKRLLEYSDSKENIITKDRKFIDSDRFCKWLIEDPLIYVSAVRTEERAQSLLDDQVFNKMWDEMASHTFEENQITKRKEIRERMIEEGNDIMRKDYGMKTIDIRIKKLNFPEESRSKIHERMIAEQKKIAAKIIAEGEHEKRNIEGQKDNIVKRLISEGRNESETLLGKAEKEVAEIYQGAYDKDMNFYMFWEKLETYKALAKSNPTLFLSTNNELLEELLNIKPKEAK